MAHRTTQRVLVAVAVIFSLLAAGAYGATICEIQEYDSNGFSPLEGQMVTVRGVVTVPPGLFQPQYTSIYVQQDSCGINVFCFDQLSFQLSVGDSVEVTGTVTEYISGTSGAGATTEIQCSSPDQIALLSSGNPAPEPADLDLKDVGVEDNEGRFVRTIGVVIDNNFDYSMYLGDPWSGASIQIYKNYNDSTDFAVFVPGDTLEITGVVLQYDRSAPFLEGYELVPRYQRDMQHAVPPTPPPPIYWSDAMLEIPAVPFRPDVGEILPIAYAAPDRSHTTIEIYDLQGRHVRTLTDATYDGHSTLPEFYRQGFFGEGVRGWDGRDTYRELVPPGTYICRLEVTDGDGRVSVATAPAVVGARLR